MFKLNLNLKWKIIIFVFFVIFLVIVAISYATFRNTGDIVMLQTNDKIAIITEYQKGIIQDLLNRFEEKVQEFAYAQDIYLYVNLLDSALLEDNNTEESFNIYKTMINTRMDKLKQQVEIDDSYQYAYITDSRGKNILDTRYDNDFNEHFAEKLNDEEYKTARTDRVYTIDDQQVMLFSIPINKDGDGQLIGYYVMAVSLDVFSKNLNQYKNMIDGEI